MTALAGDLSRRPQLDPGLAAWLPVLLFVALCFALRDAVPWIVQYPRDWIVPIAPAIDAFSTAVSEFVKPASRGLAWLLSWPMRGLRSALQWMPWPVTLVLVAAIALRAGGRSLALFALGVLLYVLAAGYWRQSMNTLALVLLAVPISVVAGFALGALAHRAPRLRGAIEVALDVMQTMPAFAYLIPLLLLFGFGPVVGLIASAIYAIPPMVRNTLLGLERVPSDIKESGLMSGCTARQGFWMVEVPTAMPQMLVGVNQSTMAAFSIVIIASIIGGFEDIGWEVLSSMRKAAFGQSLLSGLVIVLLAMAMDRITLGFAGRGGAGQRPGWLTWRRFLCILAALPALALMMHLAGFADRLPLAHGRGLIDAEGLNRWVLSLVAAYADPLEAFKNGVLYFFILPLRIGMVGAVAPASWGIELTGTVIAIYVCALCLVAATLAAILRLASGAGDDRRRHLLLFRLFELSLAGLHRAGRNAGLALRGAGRRRVFACRLLLHPGPGAMAALHADNLSVRPGRAALPGDRWLDRPLGGA